MNTFFRVIFLLFFCCVATVYSIAQKPTKKDSLLKLLDSSTDTLRINILNKISVLVVSDNPDEAIKYGQEALSLSEKLNYKKGASESLNSIGLGYYYIDNYESALTHFKKSLANSEELNDIKLIGIAYNRIADVYLYKERYEIAISYYEKAIENYKILNEKKLLEDPYNNMAITYYFMGNYEKSLEYYLKVLKIKEELGNKKEMFETIIGIGNVYLGKGIYDNALKYYEDALKLSIELNNKADIASAYNNIANVYSEQKNDQKALEFYLKSISIKEELDDKSILPSPLVNVGLVYVKLKDYSKGLDYFNRALKINQELGRKKGTAITLMNIGVVYGKQGKYQQAIENINDGIKIGKEIGNKELIKSGYEELSLIYSETGDFHKAFDYHKKFGEIKDTILNEANSKAIAEMQTKYETNKKEQEIKNLTMDKELQNEKQKKERTTFMAVGAVILIVVFFVLNGYIAKQKANKVLEEKNVAINRQKEQIEKQKDLVDHKNREITDSINYAKKIQEAILPSNKFLQSLLPEHFVFYQPKDIVSGDFYWFAKKDEKVLFAAADCTGHGVPGALMSMIGSNLLNEIVTEKGVTEPAEILNQLHKGVRTALRQDAIDTESRDGMDIALCSLDPTTGKLEYAGANRSLYLIKNNMLEVTKANKMPIGGLQAEGEERKFSSHSFQIQKQDMIYLCSDGYADQFGGKDGKKFMEKNFKDLLVKTFVMPIEDQKELFKKTINNWRGNLEQIDDILLIGIKIT